MKKLFSILALSAMLTFATANAMAQATEVDSTTTEAVADTDAAKQETIAATQSTPAANTVQAEAPATFHQVLKQKFIEGGAGFMATILVCLILGLAVAIERVIYLNLSSTNTVKLISGIEEALKKGNLEEAKKIARDTRGPIASIFYQGLERVGQGESLDMVEKAVVSYGGVEMGRLEKNISWIALFIALSPMLGFLGTIVGMVDAFDAIEAAGDIQPSLVAGGIKVALLTTLFGLIAAIILQIFYNYILSLIDDIVNKMEDASISLMDILAQYKVSK